jgi:hypothetical protein
MSTRPSADRPRRRNRASALECCRSAPSRAWESRKTVTASSNFTPCFTALASAFRGSHSNTYLVYTECRRLRGRRSEVVALRQKAEVLRRERRGTRMTETTHSRVRTSSPRIRRAPTSCHPVQYPKHSISRVFAGHHAPAAHRHGERSAARTHHPFDNAAANA